MSGHTPGPWRLINSWDIFSALGADSGDGCKASATDGWHIAEVPCTPTSVDGLGEVELGWGIRQANARLIAAAPELLEALEDVAACGLGIDLFDPPLREKIISAIAKATGEQP